MDPSVAAKLVVLVVLLFLSAFFSSAETALTTVSKIRIRALAEEGNKRAKMTSRLIEQPANLLSAILIGNNIVNLSASSLATSVALDQFGSSGAAIATGILTLLVLIFGEITPKRLATQHNEKMSLFFAPIITTLVKLLMPLIFIVNKLSAVVMFILRIDPNAKPASMTEGELLTMVEVSHEEGVIESEERQMITNVVDFGDSLAKDVMVPRVDMTFANTEMSYDELIQVFRTDKYSRLPVYTDTRDNIVGIINLKDLFFYEGEPKDFQITNFLREAYFTYEFKKTSELMTEMRREHIPMAIVLDEYGATAGLITLEDLVEEIVGEIRDEYDSDEVDSIQNIGPNEYIAEGTAKLEEVNEALGLNLESDDYDSIAGHIIHLLDHLPVQGETITDDYVTFTVDSVNKNRIDKVHLTLLPHEDGEEEENED
ncbi:MAG: HlyC/CorC family transporter [Lachnospiraceae bacterium]|nr:HlyC/CorC family transporter [Lachnospiraceae bacterium]